MKNKKLKKFLRNFWYLLVEYFLNISAIKMIATVESIVQPKLFFDYEWYDQYLDYLEYLKYRKIHDISFDQYYEEVISKRWDVEIQVDKKDLKSFEQ